LTKHKCKRCKCEKDYTEFYPRRDSVYSYCKQCSAEITIERQRKNKKQAIDYLGGKCRICGYDKCQQALQFHHKDPKEKDFEIGKSHGKVFKNIKDELDKCILLCSNCHIEVHSGYALVPEHSSKV
jgi:predicted HNH restriction endonuclease